MEKDYRFRMSQNELEIVYEPAQKRMEAHPERADEYKKMIQDCQFFNSEKDALEAVLRLIKKGQPNYQIWAKIEKIDDIYRIRGYWLVTNDGRIKMAADYIGMALMYDSTRLNRIIRENVNVDDVIAYW